MPMRKRGRPPAASAAHTRERIVQAAVDLFAEKGFHATGVAEIGDRADLQRGALYYHIGSKQELLFRILYDYTATMADEARSIADAGGDPVVTLRRLVHSHVRIIVSHRREVAIQLREMSALTGERAADLQQLREGLQQCWQRVIDAGYAAGALRAADHVVTNGLLGMMNSVTLWYRDDGAHGPDDIADILAATVLHGLVHDAHSAPDPGPDREPTKG